MSSQKPMRYGHTEGQTDVCFNDTGSCIVTCGSDGDVRIWESLDDDDPKSINIGEKAYSFALKNGRLITAVSNNTVQIHTFPEGLPDGILTRFTTNANHVVFSADGSKVAVGSSDFLVKIVDVTDSSQQKTFRGHDAPVLSVSLDPAGTFLASASCDGSVRVWKISEQNCEISWQLLQKCNDVINAKSLCRLSWQPKIGKLLAIPVEKIIKVYRRETWDHELDLSDNFITQPLNIVAWSPCGQYLAAGSIGGYIVIWKVETQECLERVKHEKGYTVCGLAWHPKGGQLAYTDTEGNLGLLENVCDIERKKSIHKAPNASSKSYDDLFDEDAKEDFLNRDFSDDDWGSKAATNDEDEDDFKMMSGRPRNRGAIIEDDENSLDTGLLKANSALDKEDEEDDLDNFVPVQPLPSDQRPLYSGPLPTPRQKPFQSGSTPTHLTHRFMVWNSVGIIRCYNDEQDNAIDVEFHDTAIHHAMHLPNNLNHTMADLSSEAILLACDSTEELASKLHCIHFSSWDPNKEWTVDMLQDEDIEAVCLGQGWAACATSSLLLRVFTIGGVQKEIFSFPGPVVSMAGHGEQLLVVFHKGTGFEGDQCLGIQLLELGKKKRQILHGESLPLSRKSYLAWIGFSAEGTPCFVDSEGIVRMLNRRHGNIWTPVCNTREHCKGKSDHYWIVGIHENPQQLRCILCKGARFPATLPRPAIIVLPFKLPFCQTATDKGQMEEQFWRSVLFHNYVDYLSQNGYEYDESVKGQAVQEQQNLLMKMFALSCTLEREFRCMELAELMTQNATSLAIKYASRSRRLILAQKLSELAAEKVSEPASTEECAEQEEEEEEKQQQPDFRNHLNAGYSNSPTEWSHARERNIQRQQNMETYEEDEEKVNTANEAKSSSPTLHGNASTSKSAVLASSNSIRVNPFKVSSSQKDAFIHSPNILDNLIRLPKKNPTMNGQGAPNKKSPIIKPLMPKPKSKQSAATAFFQPRALTAEKKVREEREDKNDAVASELQSVTENKDNKRPKTGFQIWLEENRSSILSDNPHFEETEIIKEGMVRYRILSAEERMVWTEKAKGRETSDPSEGKKRKRPEEVNNKKQESQEQNSEEDVGSAKKSKSFNQSTFAKLSTFAYKPK
ncbi:WD repeat and HMG-box DNA-binding protein 1 [Crotalus tigris]|uniref:WD repeat and HMG-box DNA-binding protein 1 n=1 Tax=Crotalus tigris TaxID=88082 RepID=UPI00192F9FDC|nr:WD repeat and HMG-box DNA-binding protein 1 [Crotalus tigris]XP_039177148.1 WD repeat and HMG-box DNA-binding protein 1 [Crotalus tigris]XP_039177155.1 WD repeat and HMG-box DNA-binding protein 1 [Crotalus tigris]